jgi:DMSO/TMAO reductase YedYZ molybdopterin-dependent catalytic subunit
VSRSAPATRRGFLEASGRATVATWLASAVDAASPGGPFSIGEVASARAATDQGDKVVGTVPFVGEGTFPVDELVGAGLGQRRGLDLSGLTPDTLVTPQDKFFVRTGAPDRLPPTPPWKVRVHGLVETPIELGLERLKRDAGDMGPHLLECAGNSRNAHFGLMSVARWSGVRLERVLTWIRRRPPATRVLVSGFDEHSTLDPGSVPGASWIFGLDDIRKTGAFLAMEMNGAPLSAEHGHPLRLVVPGWYACASIKWVNEIALVDDEAPATDHMREYAGRTHQEPTGPRDRSLMEAGRRPEGPPLARDFKPATIDVAAVPVRVEKRSGADGRVSYRIVGILWGGSVPRDALRIRLSPGVSETPVERIERGAGLPWSLWAHTFAPPAPGRYRIELLVKAPGVRTRRLDMAYYAREIEV